MQHNIKHSSWNAIKKIWCDLKNQLLQDNCKVVIFTLNSYICFSVIKDYFYNCTVMTSLRIYVYQNFELFSFMVREAGQTGVRLLWTLLQKSHQFNVIVWFYGSLIFAFNLQHKKRLIYVRIYKYIGTKINFIIYFYCLLWFIFVLRTLNFKLYFNEKLSLLRQTKQKLNFYYWIG